jgi:hypothetical protein
MVDLSNPRIDWSVLDWNHSAIRFYQSLGATPMEEWTGYRLNGGGLRRWPPRYLPLPEGGTPMGNLTDAGDSATGPSALHALRW